MKVAYVLKYFPKNSETFIHEEIYQLIKQGVEVKIFSLLPGDKEKLHKKVEFILNNAELVTYKTSFMAMFHNLFESKVKVFNIPELTIRTNILQLIKDIQDYNPDHIHSHFLFERAELISYIAEKLNIPFSITCHAKDIYIPNLRRLKLISSKAKAIITISEFNKKLLIKQGVDSKKIKVIHCGIDLDNFALTKKKKKNTHLVVLSIGRFVEKKGFIYLLKAAKIIKETHPNVEFRIIGYGPLDNQLRHFTRINHLNVNFLGKTIDEETKREIDNCDLFVLSCVKSKSGDMDGIPVVLMEAMAKGKNVISTDITGVPELINDEMTGYLVQQNNEVELAEKILNFKKLNSKVIRNKIEKDFNSKKEVKKLIGVWKNA
jgi:glycosyltransferase involved in cell wall biosynthesis